MESWNVARDQRVHELFERQALLSPQAIAVESGGRRITYAELNTRANQLARYLLNQGVGVDELVGICASRRPEMVIGLLAILKAGAAYLPLDPNYPLERLRHMLADAAPRVVLTQQELIDTLPDFAGDLVTLDETLGHIGGYVTENIHASDIGLTTDNLVYCIYTSGSTGLPKGTAMTHRSMVNLIEWHRNTFGETPARVLQFAALSFDVAFQEIFSTLCLGGTLILLDEWVRRDVPALMQLLVDGNVERAFVPPLILRALADFTDFSGVLPRSVRDIITAGEQLRVTPSIRRLFERLAGCRLHNHYGPTESHVVTSLTLRGDPGEWPMLPSIGSPISRTQLHLLNENREPVPVGQIGEIYIAGVCLARGYPGRPALTAERFTVADVQRLYRTGDLARWLADGTLEYLGRNDDQVKIRGYRIETGEIEAQLATMPEVRDVVVVARDADGGVKRLVAYIIPELERPTPQLFRARLTAVLPESMIPSAFVLLKTFPQSPNGKLDRRALPEPGPQAYASRDYESPHAGVEQALAHLWQELLKVDRVSRTDNFFELGGHSILIVQMMERLRRLNLPARAPMVYQNPTLAGLAENLQRAAEEPQAVPLESPPLLNLSPPQIAAVAGTVPGGMANIQDIYPLAPLQEGILFHHLLNDNSADTYVLPTLVRLESRQRLEDFIGALQTVIDRHDVLRTAVLWEDLPQPVQVVYRKAALPVEEFTLDPNRSPIEALEEHMLPERQKLDVRHAPLMRLQVTSESNGESWYALLKLHHLVCDHESLEAMLAEVSLVLEGRENELSPSLPYRNHVAQSLAQGRQADAKAFFQSKLADVDEPTVSFGLSEVRGKGTWIDDAHRHIEPAWASRIRAVARQYAVSPATLFHAAWALVISAASGKDDVVFGTLLLGRLQGTAGAQNTLGMFINTLPFRLRLERINARELVEKTSRELAELLNFEQASLAAAQRCSAVAGSTPLFNSLLNYLHGTPTPESERLITAPGVRVLKLREWTNYPVSMSVTDQGDGFTLTAQTDHRVDPKRVLAYVHTAIQSLVDALERAPETPALSLSILPPAERQKLIEQFNSTQRSYPQDEMIHELFEAQVRRAPGTVALVDEDRSLTYDELNDQANQLARYLIGQGVLGGDRIPVVMSRSVRMVISQLAVLKSGAAYVPIDPQQPLERLAFLIQDCGARHVLAEAAEPAGLDTHGAQWIDFSTCASTCAGLPESDPGVRVLVQQPAAYVMYTSGSTGVPKGVIVSHRGVNRLVINSDYARIGPADCIAHCSNPAFDASTFEVWGALLNGARLAVASPAVVLDAQHFGEFLQQQRVTVLFQTTALFNKHIATDPEVLGGLRYLLFGGEVCDPGLVRKALQLRLAESLVHAYGPTESTTFASTYPIDELEESADIVPIGHPISNTQMYILNSRLQPVPIGAIGEIYIGGAGIALGYLNRPELTRERFIADPFSADPQARLYKSGDLGRWRADGNIEFLGRNDGQVKLRGYRIELSEIEAHLTRHPDVKAAVVVVREEIAADKRLVAYVVSDNKSLTAASLRDHVREQLPDYMVPSAFVTLDRLPLTPNGKLDRRALPAPALDAYAGEPHEAPQGKSEAAVAEIFREILGFEIIGRRANFFELGGHSLLAMQAAVRIRSVFSLQVSVGALFESPTVEQLAKKIDELRRSQYKDLLARVASMPEQEARRLVRELKRGEL